MNDYWLGTPGECWRCLHSEQILFGFLKFLPITPTNREILYITCRETKKCQSVPLKCFELDCTCIKKHILGDVFMKERDNNKT